MVGLKKAPYFVFHPKVLLCKFFIIFFRWDTQQAWEILLTPIFDPTGHYTTQQRIKTIRAYFCTKSL